MVQNPYDVDKFGSNAQTLSNGKNTIQNSNISSKVNGIQKTKTLSVLDEIVPDYIVITNNALKSSFQVLADWKTKKGVFTIIKTTEDINIAYSGSDLQEKIRKYIIEAYSKWGAGLYILLGGDQTIVPARMVIGYNNILQAADMYYSTYNGSWNYNNDNKFYGNGGDIGVVLGRIPVKSASETSTTISKVISYEKASNISDLNYFKNNLYADAYMSKSGSSLSIFDESSIKSYCNTFVSSNINNRFICDNALCTGDANYYTASPCPGGNLELNRDNFLSSLNNGSNFGIGKFHFIYHMDHGGSQGIGTSGIDKGNSVNKIDMGSLTNGTSYQIFMSGSCHSANFTEDCIGKYYLTNSTGGGVAWIGNTDVGYTSEYAQLSYFCDAIYSTIGHPSLGRYDIGSAYQNIIKKGYSGDWRLHLLGDPEMQVWTDVPTNLNVTLSTTAVTLGQQTVNVAVSGLATGNTARICLWKGTEVYVTQEKVTNGTYPISFTTNTTGNILVTVTAQNFKPNEKTITVNQTAEPNLYISSVDFGDGIVTGSGVGNGNGKNDAGETIDLSLKVKNTGVNTSNGVTATLSCASPYINLTSNQASFGTLAMGAENTAHFGYTIKPIMPEKLENDKNPIQFILLIKDVNNVVWKDTFNISVYKDSIVQASKTSVTGGELIITNTNQTIQFNINLQNIGQATAKGLKAVLTRTSPATIISNCPNSEHTYPVIPQFGIISNTVPFQFTTGPNFSGDKSTLTFNFTITNAYNKSWSFNFNLGSPSVVTNMNFTADVAEIDLSWTKPSSNDAVAYNIYRCDADQVNDTEVGIYTKLNNTPVTSCYYNDLNSLNTLTKYFYKVAAVSATGNEGATTRMLTWTSFPKMNLFPITIDPSIGNFGTAINVADVNGDGKKEIFAGTYGGPDKGYLVGLDYYGNELYNIDNNVTTYSGFAKLGSYTASIPAIGDLNKTGKYQIIEPTRNTNATDNNYIFCYSADDVNPNDGKPDLIWNNLTPSKQYLKGAVLSNIDNSADGSLEVITCSDERGAISIYNAAGTFLRDIACVNTYASISVADLDCDGDKEIIQTSGTGIHVWHHDGTNYLGSNSLYNLTLSGYRFVSSVVVCDIDNDGHKEILTFAIQNCTSPCNAKLFAIRYDGTLVPGLDGNQTITTKSNWAQELAVGDLNNDGYLKVVTFANDGVKVWDHTGQLIQPISSKTLTDIATAGQPILADVDGDSKAEIIYNSEISSNIYAYKMDGTPVLGFPLRTKTGTCGGLNISDVDNDGKNELIARASNKIEMWQTNGLPSKIEWGSERHDQYNTGEYYTICEPTLITTNEIWNSSQNNCGDLIVKSGTLTINNNSNITLGSSSMIIVMSGASLVVDSGHILNANVRAMSGSSVTVTNNGSITLRSNAEFYSETGTNLDFQYGSIDK